MEVSKALNCYFSALAVVLTLLIIPSVYGQVGSPCTFSMLTSFTPCMGLLTNASANGTSPTPACCSALKSLMSNGTGCICQIMTGGIPVRIPFRIPINRTLALSLPQSCNMTGVPLQCKANSAPAPAPGPLAFSPAPSPTTAASPSPTTETAVPNSISPAPAPESGSTPAVNSPSPASDTGSRSGLTPPSAANPPLSISPSIVLFSLAVVIIKYC
ncbi:hypothetical protein Ancab_013320 [Ancistrocladus abbreviatus]